MIKKKLFFILICSVICAAFFSALLTNQTVSAAAGPSGRKNDFFTSPTGIFVVESGGNKTVYAADGYLGVLTSKNGGALKQLDAFKGAGGDYKTVFVYGEIIITLNGGKLAFYDDDGPAAAVNNSGLPSLLSQAFSDIALDGDILWAAQGGSLYKMEIAAAGGTLTIAQNTIYNTGVNNIVCVEPADGKILLAANNPSRTGSLYLYDFAAAAFISGFPERINDIAFFREKGKPFAAASYQDTLAAINLSDGGIKTFTPAPALPLSGGGIKAASFLYARYDELYVCDDISRAAVIFGLPDLAFKELLFASSGGEPGRLQRAEGAAAWDDKLFIADTWNGRIQVWGADGGLTEFGGGGLIRPTAAAVDALGRVYAVDNHRRVLKFDADYKYVSASEDIIPKGGAAAYITGIAAAADGRIYISDNANNMIWAADEGLAFCEYFDLGGEKPVAVCASLNRNALYVLNGGGGIARLDKDAGETVTRADINKGAAALDIDGITAFAADCRNNILALQTDGGAQTLKILRLEENGAGYSAAGTFTMPLNYQYDMYGITHMAFSPLTGNIYLTDALKSCVYTISPDDTGAEWLSADYKGPVNYADNTALDAGKYKVAPLTLQAALYDLPAASKASEILPRGTETVVLRRTLDGNDYYSFIYLPYLNKAGYVLKALLPAETDPGFVGGYLGDDPPPFTDGRVFAAAPVYKFPGRLSPKIHGGDGKELSLVKDSRVTLVPYSKAADCGPEKWYCIALDGGKIGFVNVLNITTSVYRPTTDILKTNADIVKSAADGGAFMYKKDGTDYYSMNVPPLKDGDRVQVVGKFRANNKYTEVIYQDDLGLAQGYVLTKYIKYDTATNLQWIMLGLLLGLAAVIGAGVYLIRRRKARSPR